MFLKLNSFSYLVLGDDQSSIYDILTGNIHSVPKEVSEELWNLDSGKIELEKSSHIEFYNKLQELNLAAIYKNNVIIEKMRIGLPKSVGNISINKKRIFNLYLQIEDECNLNCSYCYSDSQNYKMTGCRRYNIGGNVDVALYQKAISQAHMLGCRTLHLIGGEPLKQDKILVNLADYAESIGYSFVYIYTNALMLTDAFIQQLSPIARYVIQITGAKDSPLSQKLKEKADILSQKKVNFYLNICINHDNFIRDKEIVEFALSLNSAGVVKTYIHKDFQRDDYREYVQNSIRMNRCSTSENMFLNNIDHHPCLNGKVTVFKDGGTGVCPMLPHLATLSLYDFDLSEIITMDGVESLWDRQISSRTKCEVCSLRFYCSDCIAITSTIDEEKVRPFCRKQLMEV